MASAVLDASALLTYLQAEPGGEEVRDAIAQGAAISAVNWAETLSKLVDVGEDISRFPNPRERAGSGLFDDLLEVIPLTAEDALAIAALRLQTRAAGLSLGDRGCLALGLRLGLPVLTADRTWVDIGLAEVTVRAIR